MQCLFAGLTIARKHMHRVEHDALTGLSSSQEACKYSFLLLWLNSLKSLCQQVSRSERTYFER
jgi:hypothetical protein